MLPPHFGQRRLLSFIANLVRVRVFMRNLSLRIYNDDAVLVRIHTEFDNSAVGAANVTRFGVNNDDSLFLEAGA